MRLTRRKTLLGSLGAVAAAAGAGAATRTAPPPEATMDVQTLRASERGHLDYGWLDTRHTFSFGGYYNPARMGFGPLRVINDDRVIGGAGFPTHPHADMEILTWVLEGALEHRDSMGNGSIIRPGDAQLMSAGRGLTHSEWNHSERERVRFLQIWIQPDRRGGEPGYQQVSVGDEARRDRWHLVASSDGREGSLRIKQDAIVRNALLSPGASLDVELAAGRGAWLHVATGQANLDGTALDEGDAAFLLAPSPTGARLALGSSKGAEVLLFDLPPG